MIHVFSFKDKYYLLDVESGALHRLDGEAYSVLKALEAGDDPYSAGCERSVTDEVLADVRELSARGAFNAETPTAELDDMGVIKSMCLNIAHDCNLRCSYCFASTGEFGGGRMLMSREVVERALDFLVSRSGTRRSLEVDLFGGEPLMNMDAVRHAVEYGRKLERLHGKEIHFTITTNCLALDDETIDFINKEMFNVVLSVDGRREVHDAQRKTVTGGGSYDIIIEKAKKLVQRRGDGEHYVRGTFTARNLDFANDVTALREQGFRQISIEPVVLGHGEENELLSSHLPRIFEEYDRLADMLLEADGGENSFNFFHFMVDLGQGPCLRKRLSGCGAGVEYVAVAPDGGIYPCHQFDGNSDFLMGNVLDGTYDEKLRKRFFGCSITSKPSCRECWAKYFCSGGCAANAYKLNGDISKPHELSCAMEKKRTECALGIYGERRK